MKHKIWYLVLFFLISLGTLSGINKEPHVVKGTNSILDFNSRVVRIKTYNSSFYWTAPSGYAESSAITLERNSIDPENRQYFIIQKEYGQFSSIIPYFNRDVRVVISANDSVIGRGLLIRKIDHSVNRMINDKFIFYQGPNTDTVLISTQPSNCSLYLYPKNPPIAAGGRIIQSNPAQTDILASWQIVKAQALTINHTYAITYYDKAYYRFYTDQTMSYRIMTVNNQKLFVDILDVNKNAIYEEDRNKTAHRTSYYYTFQKNTIYYIYIHDEIQQNIQTSAEIDIFPAKQVFFAGVNDVHMNKADRTQYLYPLIPSLNAMGYYLNIRNNMPKSYYLSLAFKTSRTRMDHDHFLIFTLGGEGNYFLNPDGIIHDVFELEDMPILVGNYLSVWVHDNSGIVFPKPSGGMACIAGQAVDNGSQYSIGFAGTISLVGARCFIKHLYRNLANNYSLHQSMQNTMDAMLNELWYHYLISGFDQTKNPRLFYQSNTRSMFSTDQDSTPVVEYEADDLERSETQQNYTIKIGNTEKIYRKHFGYYTNIQNYQPIPSTTLNQTTWNNNLTLIEEENEGATINKYLIYGTDNVNAYAVVGLTRDTVIYNLGTGDIVPNEVMEGFYGNMDN